MPKMAAASASVNPPLRIIGLKNGFEGFPSKPFS
jgi:hypothetical protein